MEAVIHYILELGPTVALPFVIILFSLAIGMKFGEAFKAGLSIGIGFVGIGLVIGLMLDSVGQAAQAMTENFHLNLKIIDLGWPATSPMTWASRIAIVAIPVAIAVNILMIVTKTTRVVNVDIWNIWHMTFTGAMLDIATGSYYWGIAGVCIHAALVYKLGDWFAYDVKTYFELDGVAIPHGTSAYLGPIAVFVDEVLNRIPLIRSIHFTEGDLRKRAGFLGEPSIQGFLIGCLMAVLAGYSFKAGLQLSVQLATVMILLPRVIKPIMEGLRPVAVFSRARLNARFGTNAGYLIGLDPALLLGQTTVVAASLLFVPLTILIAALTPGNRILPLGDLPTVGFFIAMAVAVHRANLFRILVSGTIIMSLTVWIATQMAALQTVMAKQAGSFEGSATTLVGSMDQGGSPITYILVQLIKREQITPLLLIGGFYIVCLFLTFLRARRQRALAKSEAQ